MPTSIRSLSRRAFRLRPPELLESRLAPAADLNVTYIERTPRYEFNAAQNAPAPGDIVTFEGHVRNWDEATATAEYRWELDGVPVASGTLTGLAAGEERVVTLPWAWQADAHRVRLTVDPANAVAESTEFNNTVEDRTDGLAVGFWVEQSVYNYFQLHQRDLGIGANSWEDWAQRHVRAWNQANVSAVYPTTPQGVTDRVRLDKVTIVPDGALPLHGGLPGNNPDSSDRTVDLMWGFGVDLLSGTFYANTTSAARGNAFFFEESLVHEVGHARYLIDHYGMDLHNTATTTSVQLLEGGAPVAGTPLMPFLAFGEVLHYNQSGGMMNGPWPYGDTWSPHEAAALQQIAGRRASQGNMNSPGNIGVYLQDLPSQNRLRVTDADGQPLVGASVRWYQAAPAAGLYGKVIDNTPEYTLTADAAGEVVLPQNPFIDTPYNYWEWVPSGSAAVRVEHAGRVWYRFVEITDFNLQYWAGNTVEGQYTLALPVPGSGPRAEVSGYGQPIAAGDTTPAAADHTDFGAVPVGGSRTRSFVVRNAGDGFLTLTGNPRVEVIGSAAFTVINQPADRVGADLRTTFTLRYSPTAAGGQTATIRIVTSAGTFEFAVAGSADLPAPPAAANVGQPYLFDFGPHAATAAVFSATGLPAGLTLDAASGVLSGSPAAGTDGTYQVSVARQTLAGTVGLGTFTLTVGDPPAFTSGPPPADARVGVAYGPFTVTASGVPAPTLAAAGLPAGLTFDPATGVLDGTPTAAGSFAVTLTATSTAGTATQAFTLIVTQEPAFTSGSPPTAGQMGIAYGPFTVTAAGFPAPTFSAVGLPAGLSLDPATGVLSGSPTVAGSFAVTLTAANSVGTATQAFTLSVTQAPVFTGGLPPTTGQVGVAYGPFLVTVEGTPAPDLTAAGLPAGLSFDPATGELSGTPTAAGSFAVTFTATSTAGTATRAFTLLVNLPPMITSGPPPAVARVGVAYGPFTVVATGFPAPTFGVVGLPAGLSFDPVTGVLSGTPTAAGNFAITLTAVNSTGTATQAFTLSVTQAPVFTSGDPPAVGRLGVAYGPFTVTTGGNPPATYSAVGLPPGLTLDPVSGVLSGTPTATGSFTITLTAANSVGTATQAFTLLVTRPPTITSVAPPSAGRVGDAYGPFTVVASGVPSPTFSAVGLPAGLTLDPATGVLSGSPTASGSFTVTVTATNAGGSATQTFVLAVDDGPAFTSGTPPTTGRVGVAYGPFTVAASGFPAPTFSATGLPAGLALAADGTLSGTPTAAGSFAVTLTATNASGSVSRTFTLVVAAAISPPVVTTTTLPAGTVGTAYSQALAATGTAPITWTATGLPAGLTLSVAGVLAGTPTAAGTFSVTLTATNAAGQGSATRTLVVNPRPAGPAITTVSLPAAVRGTAYTATLTATGGPVTWTAVGLPAGLALDATTGVVSGTPATAGTFAVTVTARAAAGPDAVAVLPLSVAASARSPGLNVLTVSGPAGTVDAFTFDANGRRVPRGGRFTPFPGVGGVPRATAADVTGDGVADLVYVTGPGGGDLVRVVDGATGGDVLAGGTFSAYPGEQFTSIGLFVQAADLDGDGRAEIVVSPDQGGGARVQVFAVVGGRMVLRANFFGIEDAAFRGGGRLAVGDVDGDGFPEVVVAAGFGGGPRVAVFSGRGLTSFGSAGTPPRLVGDFFVFEPALRNGTWVAAGDLDGDGRAELVFGGGPGGGPRVYGLSGAELTARGAAAAPVVNFFAGDPALRGGVHVAVKDADGDSRLDVVAASGDGVASVVTTYPGKSLTPQGTPPALESFDPFGLTLANGVFVG